MHTLLEHAVLIYLKIIISHFYQKSNKGIETRKNRNKQNGLGEIGIIKIAKENKEENQNNNRFNVFADDTLLEEKIEDKMEIKMEKWKWKNNKGLNWMI